MINRELTAMNGILGINIYNPSAAFYAKGAVGISMQLPDSQTDDNGASNGEVSTVGKEESNEIPVKSFDTRIPDDVVYVLQSDGNSLVESEIDIENTVEKTIDEAKPEKVVESVAEERKAESSEKIVEIDNEEETTVLVMADDEEDSSSPVLKILEDAELSKIEEIEVDNLKQTDVNVKRHERAHINAGGQYAGNATYTYVEGPDGNRYATSGEVMIDISEVRNNPRATIAKMQVVKKAALAPSDPSNKDRQVANKATSIESKARRELRDSEKNDSSIVNISMLYNQMVMVYGKENVKDFSKFSVIAQDY